MHLGILSGLMVALAGSFWGGASAHTTGAAYQTNIHTGAALYSILATTATTPTLATGTTPTAPAPSTLQPATTITAASTVTHTGTLTATATTTNTIPPSTPIPLPTTAPASNLQINPFDLTFLTGTASGQAGPFPNLGPFAIAYLVLMLVLIGTSIYFLRFRRPQWKGTNPVLFKAVNRFAPYGIWIGVLGIIFLIFRIIPIDFFNLRFWLYLDFLALLGLAGWMLYWYRTSYPKEMAKFLKTQKARQYMPGGSGKIASRSTPIGAPPGKGSQPPKAGGAGRPPQQSGKNRRRK